jgi:hypothetical protein
VNKIASQNVDCDVNIHCGNESILEGKNRNSVEKLYSLNGYLKLLQLNCRSIVSKSVEFSTLVEIQSPDVIIGTESWLKEDMLNDEVFPMGFTYYRRDRIGRGGGLFLGIRECIPSILHRVEEDFEMLCVFLFPGTDFEVELTAVYRPPNEGLGILDRLRELYEDHAASGREKPVIIAGDLNLPHVDWEAQTAKGGESQQGVNDLIRLGGFSQVVKAPTRGENLLDVFLVRPIDVFFSSNVIEGISDHKAVSLCVASRKTKKDLKGKWCRQYSRMDTGGFSNYLTEKFSEWVVKGSCVNEVWENFKILLTEGTIRYVPCKTLKANPDPEYYTVEIRRLKRRVRRLHKIRNRGGMYLNNYKLAYQKLNSEKLKAKDQFLRNSLKDQGWSGLYKFIRRRRKGINDLENISLKYEGRIINDNMSKAKAFKNFFSGVYSETKVVSPKMGDEVSCEPFEIKDRDIRHRLNKIKSHASYGPDGLSGELIKRLGDILTPFLKHLFNVIINNGDLPDDWKKSYIIPIYKNGHRNSVDSYRPVSLTCIVCKLMEHLIADYIKEVLRKKNWLWEGQHGFRKGYSCESQLTSLYQDLVEGLDGGKQIDGVLIDFAKAFDRVDHEVLMNKISLLGLDRRVVIWINSFVTGRSQMVRVGEVYSDKFYATSGVPQGSVLGPLLFIIYVNDISKNIKSHIRMFADDCIIYRVMDKLDDGVILQNDLNLLEKWSSDNKMVINASKTKLIRFRKGRRAIVNDYHINGSLLSETKDCKYLGVLLSRDLKWGPHIERTTTKAFRVLYFLMRSLGKSCSKTKEFAYKTFVRPILEYGAAVWDPHLKGEIKQLAKVQRLGARFVFGNFKRKASVTDMQKNLGWRSLESRRREARIKGIYKTYVGDPAWRDLKTRLKSPSYCSRKDHKFKIEPPRQRSNALKFSFLHRGIEEWNSLSVKILEPFPVSHKVFVKRLRGIDF